MLNQDVKNFYDLEVWKKAHELTLAIYIMTRSFPQDELYGIVSQIRRAASSVSANIAEGFERYHFKEKIRFYYQARGPVAEVENFLLLAKDLHFIEELLLQKLMHETEQVRKLINGLIRSIERQSS